MPPSFLEYPPPNAIVDIGEKIELTCLARGYPLPTYTWLHNGTVIVRDSRVDLENGTLTITKARKDDRGNYTCVAWNEAGTIPSQTMLMVYGPPEPPHSLKVNQTGSSWFEIQWLESLVTGLPLSGYVVWHCLSFDCQGQKSV